MLHRLREYLHKKVIKKFYPLGFKGHFDLLFKDSIPLILTNLSEFTFSLVSILFCGHLGRNELDAVALANTLINVFGLAVVVGLTSAAETILPQSFTSKNKKNVGIVLQKGIIISLMASIVAISMLINSKEFMIFLHQDREVTLLVDQYLLIHVPSVLFYGITNILNRYLQSQNIVNPILLINFLANILNIILQATFIFCFKLGITGAAISVVISNIFLMIATISYIYFSKLYVDTWPGWSWECLEDWRSYLKLGIPGIFMLASEWLIYEIGAFVSGSIGTVELGAQAIVLQVLGFCYMIPSGISVAGNILVGHLLGMNKPEEAMNALRVVVTFSTICGIVTVFLIISTASILPWAFTQDIEVQKYSSNILILIGVMHLLDVQQATFSGILRSVGAQLAGSIISLIGFYIVGLPIAIFLMLKTRLSLYGFWLGMIIGDIVLVGFQVSYVLNINWKEKTDLALAFTQVTDDSTIAKPFDTDTNQKAVEIFQIENLIYHNNIIITFKKPQFYYRKLLYSRVYIFIIIFIILSASYIIRGLARQQFYDVTSRNKSNVSAYY